MFPGAHNVWGKPRLQGEKEMRGPLPAATQGTAADGAVETSVKPQYTYILTELMSFRPGQVLEFCICRLIILESLFEEYASDPL